MGGLAWGFALIIIFVGIWYYWMYKSSQGNLR